MDKGAIAALCIILFIALYIWAIFKFNDWIHRREWENATEDEREFLLRWWSR